jgi:N-acyl-D-amino-acid deacylase
MEEWSMFDILIKNGEIIDGSGAAAFKGDIGIKDEIILEIAPSISEKAMEVINAEGLVVSPGFIDMHSHSDFSLLLNPFGESKIRQGITTELVGNCGFTAAPVRKKYFHELMEYLVNTVILSNKLKKEWKWHSQKDFLNTLTLKGIAFNIASLVGHGTLRIAAMGFANRKPSTSELNSMLEMLEYEMENGIFGLSAGLQYEPGSFASAEELIELCRVVAEYNGIYTVHMKSEGNYLLECILQAIDIAEKTGVSVEISHLKAVNPRNWSKVSEALKLIEEANEKGISVDFDVYPYTAYGSGLMDLIPPQFKDNGVDKMVSLLKSEETRKNVINSMTGDYDTWENPMEGNSWNKVRIASIKTKKNKKYEGKNLNEISKEMGCSPHDAVINLLAEEKGSVKMIFFGMEEKGLCTLMKHPRAIFCTDGRAVAPYGELSKGKVHPRYYGAFPRILGRYAGRRKLLSLEEAVNKMTLRPAQKIGLKQRGMIKKGYYADIVIFDKTKIIDRATFDNPHSYPEGIMYVIVNGTVVISKGEHTGRLPGKLLTNIQN